MKPSPRFLVIFALSVLSLVTTALASESFTLNSNISCSYRLYTFASRYTCTLIPETLADGSSTYQAFYIDEKNDGTFSGVYYTDPYNSVEFQGTYTGPQKAPTSIDGSWTGGNVSAVFGAHQIAGYRGTKITVPYLVNGSGSE
jgi:hypothetical protein